MSDDEKFPSDKISSPSVNDRWPTVISSPAKIDHHLNHLLSQILYSDILYSISLVHIFFIDLLTEIIFDILFLWRVVAKILGPPKFLINWYPHKFTIISVQ